MTTLPMMYVYFDTTGSIKSISPSLISLEEGISVATLLLSEVDDFLVGKKSVTDYYMKRLGTHYKLTKRIIPTANQVRSLDNFLTEIHTMPKSKDAYVLIENYPKSKTIRISINDIVMILAEEGTDEDQERVKAFSVQAKSFLFFTEPRNPFALIYTLEFSPKELLRDKELLFSYGVDLSNVSVYTKRLIERYSYKKITNEL